MPSKYLYQTQKSVSSDATGDDNAGEDDDDGDSKQGDHLDSSEDYDNDMLNQRVDIDTEREKSEVKVRKLVIKSDGMNFVSSFKRKSFDRQDSTIELCDTAEDSNEEEEAQGAPRVPDFGMKHIEMLGEEPSSVTGLDEDTNEYSNEKFESDEAERAAMAISSAEESEDTQCDNDDSMYAANSYNLNSEKGALTNSYTSFSAAGHDFIADQSPLSNIDSGESNTAVSRLLGESCVDNSDTMDKFDMYQPITECLTDSEENSFYTTETGTEHGKNTDHSGWRTRLSAAESTPHNDQDQDDVTAQMESAIDSILSLSHGASNSLFQSTSQTSSSLSSHSGNSRPLLSLQSEHHSERQSNDTQEESADDSEDFSTDLDIAVNSILM